MAKGVERGMKRLYLGIIYLAILLLLGTKTLESPFVLSDNAYAYTELGQLSEVLRDLKASELSMCISFVKNSDMGSEEMADFVYKWNPDEHKKTLASVFRTKITRLAERLKRLDYEQLVIDIDLIKNSHITTGQMIDIIKGIRKR